MGFTSIDVYMDTGELPQEVVPPDNCFLLIYYLYLSVTSRTDDEQYWCITIFILDIILL